MTAPPPTAARPLSTLRPLALLCALLAPLAAAQTTQPYRPLLLAHGSGNLYWVATVETSKEGGKLRQKTVIRRQLLPGGEWQDVGTLFQPALALADVQGDLAILLDDGTWKRVGAGGLATGLATGPILPGVGPVLAWGSSPSSLYAVRTVEGGRDALNPATTDSTAAPASRPATSPATTQAILATRPTISSRPSTRPAPLVLMQYDRGQWVGVAELPPSVPATPMALAVVGDKPLIATSADGATIRTLAWSDGRWQDWGDIRAPAAGRFDLLAAPNLVALWAIDVRGAMAVYIKREGETWQPLKEFSLPGNVAADAQRTLALAAEELRLEVLSDGKLLEQRYDPSGVKRGTMAALPVPQSNQPSPLSWILQSVAMLVMVVVLITFYRRRAARPPPSDE
jgi:hypothetical protein